MSTAGKVLSIIVGLMMAVWLFLISAVAQINLNATEALEKVKADLVKVKSDLEAATANTIALKTKIDTEQMTKERELRLVRIGLSTAERQLTSTREDFSRVEIALANYTKSVATAKQSLEVRKREGVDLAKAKADEEATVKRLQGENADLLARLAKLRDDFKGTLESNRGVLDSIGKPPARPAGRPASYVRP